MIKQRTYLTQVLLSITIEQNYLDKSNDVAITGDKASTFSAGSDYKKGIVKNYSLI